LDTNNYLELSTYFSRDLIDAQKVLKIDLDPFAEEYNMKHKRRGVALILNHVHFDKMATRKGSEKDSQDLKASLDKFGFDVRIYNDPATTAITKILQSSKYYVSIIRSLVALCYVSLVSMTDQTDDEYHSDNEHERLPFEKIEGDDIIISVHSQYCKLT